MGRDELNEKKQTIRSLFDDLSVAQLAAGALAAVTSMLLSSSIGIAGSVIGVAVGSVVSAVSSQLYKKFLAASAEKIRDIPVVANVIPGADGGDSAQVKAEAVTGAGSEDVCSDAESDAGETTVLGEQATRAIKLPATATNVDAMAPDAVLLRARVDRERRKQRRVLAVAVGSSLAAVLVTAGIVSVLTTGEGLGTKPEPLWTPAHPQASLSQVTSANDADNASGGAPSASDVHANAGVSSAASSASSQASSASSSAGSHASSSSQATSSSSASTDAGTSANPGADGSDNAGDGNAGDGEQGAS